MAFEHVSTTETLKGNFRKEIAWDIISDFSRYPIIMGNVDEVKIHEKNEKEGISEWFVTIEGAPLRWLEKDFYDKEKSELRFESIEGDFDNINGRWKIENYDYKGIKISFDFDYNLGIPVIEEVLGNILKEKMKSNIDLMINAVKKELKKEQAEERNFKRFSIEKHHTIRINNTEIRPLIINVSQGGMMFEYDGKPDLLSVALKINGSKIESDIVINDLNRKNYRAVFKEAIDPSEMEKIINELSPKTLQVQDALIIEKKYAEATE